MSEYKIEKLIELQKKLSKKVVKEGCPKVRKIAGVDLAFSKENSIGFVAIVVLKYPELELIETKTLSGKVNFPYIPGLLAYREAPLILKAIRKVKEEIDIIMIDGQGIAHPRRFGIASHIGIILNKPTIGVAKSLLIGKHEEVASEKGSYSYITDRNEIIGVALRTKENVKPVYVSIGHMVSLEYAMKIVLDCTKRYRLPEPVRLAHIEVEKVRREYEALR